MLQGFVIGKLRLFWKNRKEYAEHSGEVLELTDERMIEIGEYFKKLIMEIEAN